MKRFLIIFFALGLASCELGDRDNKRALSTLIGLGLGGTIGFSLGGNTIREQLLTTTFIAAGGALTGYFLAEKLLPQDRENLDSTAFNALNGTESGRTVNWGEEGKGAWGTFTPLRDYVSEAGMPCREYIATINYNGEAGEIHEAACQLENGNWRTVAA